MDFVMNLQELCIAVISVEFDRYYTFFNNDDAQLKRKFEFLQRAYSFQILLTLEDLENLNANYIEVLVNTSLKVLDTGWFQGVPWETVTAKVAEVGCNIREMYFYDTGNEEKPWQNIIQYIFNLEVAVFIDNCNDEMLKCIAQFCPNIVKIDVSDCRGVTNKGIKHLCTQENGKPLCLKLKQLLIANSGVTGEGVCHLVRNLRSLEVTDFPELAIAVIELQLLSVAQPEIFRKVQLYNLTSLSIPLSYSDDLYSSFAICFLSCPRLKYLSCPVKKEDHLDEFPSELQKLELKCLLAEINIDSFLRGKGSKLTHLSVSNCLLSVSTLAECCPCLKHLTLQNVNFKSEGIIRVIWQLETCIFESTKYEATTTKSVTLILKSSPKLKRLLFEGCDFSSTVLKRDILAECCPCPEHLTLQNVNFKNEGIIRVFQQLDTCIFEDTKYDATTIKSVTLTLKSSPKLKRLLLKRCEFSYIDLVRCIIIFPKCRRSTVDMEFANKFFEDCPSLELLELQGKI